MFILRNNSNTAIIVVHEIYGVNQHIKNFCHSLATYDFDVFCPDFIGRKTAFDYSKEGIAYENFMENVGFEKALRSIKSLISELKDDYQKVFVVGFSVGATVSWLCSEEKDVHGIVGYYGSRIRNYVKINPQCPTLLFYPQEEKSFNIDELISALDQKKIETHKFDGAHGFGDPFSHNYQQESSQKAFNLMIDFISKHVSN